MQKIRNDKNRILFKSLKINILFLFII